MLQTCKVYVIIAAMKKTNVVLFGASGRMGREIISAANKSEDINIVAGIATHNDKIDGVDVRGWNDFKLNDRIDAVLDFSNPQALGNSATLAKDEKVPLIIGTSGYSEKDLEAIKNTSLFIPIFKGGNFRFKIYEFMKKVWNQSIELGLDWSITIEETHNKFKHGVSATANEIAKMLGRDVPIKSIRTQDDKFISKHDVIFSNPESKTSVREITLRDMITSREPIAQDILKVSKMMGSFDKGMFNLQALIEQSGQI
jgi:dihydrodipicolinate reductase